MTGPGNQPNDETFAPFNRDRYVRHVAQLGEFGKDRRKLSVGMTDHPSLHDRTIIRDEAYPMMS